MRLGKKELENKELTIFRRDNSKKERIKENDLIKYIEKTSMDYDKNLISQADKLFNGRIVDADSKKEAVKLLKEGRIVRCGFCSVEKEGVKCAEVVEKEMDAEVRGTKFLERNSSDKCIICSGKAKSTVYIAKSY